MIDELAEPVYGLQQNTTLQRRVAPGKRHAPFRVQMTLPKRMQRGASLSRSREYSGMTQIEAQTRVKPPFFEKTRNRIAHSSAPGIS